jgi:hypothetical protein
MSNKDLFKEAIADAKAVREAALANAKVALEEALAPKLQNMISAKLQEMEYEEDMDEARDKDELDEKSLGQDTYRTDDVQHVGARERHAALEEGDDELEEDFDLSEILAELSKEKEDLDEAEEGEEEEEEEEEVEEDEPEIEDEPEEDSEEKITDLTFDELKDIIKDMISAEMGDDNMDDMGGEEEMAVNFDGEEKDEIAVDEDYNGDDDQEIEDDIDDEINLEELLAELDSLDEADDKDDMYEAKKKKKEDKKEDEKDEMKEAIETINALRNELNEQNLLNAKLLYVNKIFKAKNLSESQKLKVIASFDKATTPKQAKELFESIQSSDLGASKKSQIKESLGFASKAAGVAPKNSANTIVESNDVIARMQKLANIIK